MASNKEGPRGLLQELSEGLPEVQVSQIHGLLELLPSCEGRGRHEERHTQHVHLLSTPLRASKGLGRLRLAVAGRIDAAQVVEGRRPGGHPQVGLAHKGALKAFSACSLIFCTRSRGSSRGAFHPDEAADGSQQSSWSLDFEMCIDSGLPRSYSAWKGKPLEAMLVRLTRVQVKPLGSLKGWQMAGTKVVSSAAAVPWPCNQVACTKKQS